MEPVDLSLVFEDAVRRACDLVPRLAHVDPARVLVLGGSLAPTRFGQTVGLRASRRPLRVEGCGALYAMEFSASLLAAGCGDPAYRNEFAALDTVMHELWHVAPACDGTIRPMRHGAAFNAVVRSLRRDYLRAGGEPLPSFASDARVLARRLGRREGDAFPVRARVAPLSAFLPSRVSYVCPSGHVVVRTRRLSRPSSCAACSSTFDARFLLRQVSLEPV